MYVCKAATFFLQGPTVKWHQVINYSNHNKEKGKKNIQTDKHSLNYLKRFDLF